MISWKPLGRRSIRNIFTITEEKHKEYLHHYGGEAQGISSPLRRRSTRNIFTIKEEKHKEYLHNAGCKSLSLDYNKSNKNSKQCSSLQDRNIDKNEPKETNNQFPWASGTCAIVIDSMVKGIDEKWLWQGHGNFKVFHFSGARI